MSSPLTAGSTWRRWDPHVHLPGTLLNDEFHSTTIEQALDVLAACSPTIEVVGITDYFSTASFRCAHKAWESGSGREISYLFPNVELRLNDATARGSGVNVHVLAAAEHVDLLDEILRRLTFSYRDAEYSADSAGLIALGRAYRGNPSLTEDAGLREGVKQFKVSFTQLKSLFERDARLREHCLVAVAAGSNDGTAGLQDGNASFAATREEVEQFAHIIFTATPKNIAFWRGEGVLSERELEAKYGGVKP